MRASRPEMRLVLASDGMLPHQMLDRLWWSDTPDSWSVVVIPVLVIGIHAVPNSGRRGRSTGTASAGDLPPTDNRGACRPLDRGDKPCDDTSRNRSFYPYPCPMP